MIVISIEVVDNVDSQAFTSEFIKIYLFYTLKFYFIYFTNSFNNILNISVLIFIYNQ